jgi:hypothetical protein
MAKYLNSSMSFIVNGLSYEPWVRPKVHSDGNICLKNCPLPPGLKTCWELNMVEAANPTWSLRLPPCGTCLVFHQDKGPFAHLQPLASTHGAPYQYRCGDTVWKGSVAATAKRPPVSTGATEIHTTKMPPRQRAKVSATQTIPEANRVVQMMDLPPSPKSPAWTTDITMPTVISEQGKMLNSYLVRHLDLQDHTSECPCWLLRRAAP